MKRMDIFCSTPASTAICSSIDQRSMVRRSHKTLLDHDQLQRQSPSPRTNSSTTTTLLQRIKINKSFQNHNVPCSSELPINPKPRFEKSRKSTSCSTYGSTTNNKQASSEMRRKSSADIYDLKSRRSISSHGRGDSSSRYLLSETPSFVVDWFPESHQDDDDDDRAVVSGPAKPNKFRSLSSNNTSSSSALIRSSSTSRSRHQVVVLRVSLHCKGCEGKVKKHLSKMEGVTSFSVDLAAKKVTVIGDITPLGVLASVSKVKSAQLWPSPTSSSSSSSSPWSA